MEFLTVKQVAERLDVRQETVRRWINEGKLKGTMIGGTKTGYRILASEVERAVRGDERQHADHEQQPADSLLHDAPP